MHPSCMDSLNVFVEAYLAPYGAEPLAFLDVGSAVVEAGQAADREAFTRPAWKYIGLDIEHGHNVDVVVKDPYHWTEVADASVDAVICNQVLEHAEWFWLTVKEIARVLKPGGLAFLCAPSAGIVHRYPTDCWRFFPDGLPAVARYAELSVLENHRQSFPFYKNGNMWRDATLIAQKPSHTSGTPSVIAPTSSKNALAAREQALLASASAWQIKHRAIKMHLRAISRILRHPVSRMNEM